MRSKRTRAEAGLDLHDGPRRASPRSPCASTTSAAARRRPSRPPRIVESRGPGPPHDQDPHAVHAAPAGAGVAGVVAALSQLSEKMKIRTTRAAAGRPTSAVLDTNAQGVLFSSREAVNNARKHVSQQIRVRLYRRGICRGRSRTTAWASMSAQSMPAMTSAGSLGMVNMRERAELIEGAASRRQRARHQDQRPGPDRARAAGARGGDSGPAPSHPAGPAHWRCRPPADLKWQRADDPLTTSSVRRSPPRRAAVIRVGLPG